MSIGFYKIWLQLFLTSINSDTISNDVFYSKIQNIMESFWLWFIDSFEILVM